MHIFMELAFDLSNRVTDSLESCSIPIYFSKHMSLYTQNEGRMPQCLNHRLKVNEMGEAEVVN
jgi:hypothetical protein